MLFPEPTEITLSEIQKLSDTYPEVIRSTYDERLRRRVPGSGKENPLEKALQDDEWRYDELPNQLREWLKVKEGEEEGKSKDGFRFDLEVLERLVRWKITHGASRPFLLAQIRKNDSKTVISVVRSAFLDLPPNDPPRPSILKSLQSLTSLRGVGPATASLILSLYCPDSIPFFQDEMFIWLCRHDDDGAGVKSKADLKNVKLKYNVKEYEELLEKVKVVWDRLEAADRKTSSKGNPSKEWGRLVPCWMLEKAAFVLVHQKEEEESQSVQKKRKVEVEEQEQGVRANIPEQVEREAKSASSTARANKRRKGAK